MTNENQRIDPSFDDMPGGAHLSTSRNSLPQRSQPQKSWLRTLLKLIGGLVLILGVAVVSGVGKLIGKSAGQSSLHQEPVVSNLVKQAVDAANQKAPVTVGDGVTLVRATEGTGNTVVYSYDIRSSIVLNAKFMQHQTEQLHRDYCGEKMRAFVSNGISAEWHYKHGNKSYVIRQTPVDCESSN